MSTEYSTAGSIRGIDIKEVISGFVGSMGGVIMMTIAMNRSFLAPAREILVLYAVYALLGIFFPIVVYKFTNPLSSQIISMSKHSDHVAKVLAMNVKIFGLASITFLLGLGVGVVLWAVVGSILAPYWLNVTYGYDFVVPTFSGWVLAAHLLYGQSLGGLYGLIAQAVK